MIFWAPSRASFSLAISIKVRVPRYSIRKHFTINTVIFLTRNVKNILTRIFIFHYVRGHLQTIFVRLMSLGGGGGAEEGLSYDVN